MATILHHLDAWGRRQPLAFATVMVMVLMSLAAMVATSGYQTNDDPIMAMIASGTGVALEPDEHLIFTNVTIGLVLKSLYQMAPDAPWYGIYLLSVHVLAHVALLYSIVLWRFALRHVFLYCLFFCTAGIFLLGNLQFTSTAFLAAQSGTVLCLTCLCRRTEFPDCSIAKQLVAGSLMVILGSLIRIDAFYALIVIAGPASVWLALRERRKEVLRPAIVTGVAILGLSLGLQQYNKYYYESDPAWAGFYDYNKLRVKFNDYCWTNYSPDTKPIFDRVGWSLNDHEIFVRWYFVDQDLFSTAKMQEVLESRDWFTAKHGFKNVKVFLRDLREDLAIWAVYLIVPIFYWQANSIRTVFSVAAPTVALAFALCAYLALTAKTPPPRVYYPAMVTPITLLFVLARLGAASERRFWSSLALRMNVDRIGVAMPPGLSTRRFLPMPAVVCAVTLLAVGLAFCGNQARGIELAEKHRELVNVVNAMTPTADELFISWSDSFPMESISPLDRPSRWGDLRLMVLGWPLHSPLHRRMMEEFRVDDLSKQISHRSDIYLISTKILVPYFDTYFRERFQSGVLAKSVVNSSAFDVYSVTVDETTPEGVEAMPVVATQPAKDQTRR